MGSIGVARNTLRSSLGAANEGNAEAQKNLGHLYATGRGVEQDDEAAVKWFRRAANQGRADAQNSLGRSRSWSVQTRLSRKSSLASNLNRSQPR